MVSSPLIIFTASHSLFIICKHFIYRTECHKYIDNLDPETVMAYDVIAIAASDFAEARLNGHVQWLD
jgi:hypothetical protein